MSEAITSFAWGKTPKSPLFLGVMDLHWTPQVYPQMASQSVERFKHGAQGWQTDDRQREADRLWRNLLQ